MVQAWILNECDSDHRFPLMTDPPQFIDINAITEKTGVEFFKVDPATYENDKFLIEFRKERGYTNDDMITINEDLPAYDKTMAMFWREHIHAVDQIRLVLEGSGYFDIRDDRERWIRIKAEAGDLFNMPGGIYHRFTLDTQNYIKAKRYFAGEPAWSCINRPADDHPTRQQYIAQYRSV